MSEMLVTSEEALSGLDGKPAILLGTQLFASATVCTAVRQGAPAAQKIADLRGNIALLKVLLSKLEQERADETHPIYS